jgi:futalosine hydrolase
VRVFFLSELYAMKIMLVAATRAEIEPTLQWLETLAPASAEGSESVEFHTLITGVGMTATSFRMGQHIAFFQPDWIVNIGIAGAIDRSLRLGEVVQVTTEVFADLGIEEADGTFHDLFEVGLADRNLPPFAGGILNNPERASIPLAAANGLTVNKVHGYESSINALRGTYPEAQIESMEGAAFFYACLNTQVPFLALRGISNYVEKRNRANWQIGTAIQHVNTSLQMILTDRIEQFNAAQS